MIYAVLETKPYNYLAFKLILNQSTIETFVIDNNIDLLAFIAYVRKSNDNECKVIKNIINGKTDIYTKNNLIKKVCKN